MGQAERGSAGRLKTLAPVLTGLVLFCLGLWALYHLLQPVDGAKVIAQMRSMPAGTLLAAVGATALAYLSLIGYDWWALDFLGKRIPARAVFFGGFLGYAFGNSIGVSVISGGAVRYRVYSAYGLNAFDVAAIASYIAVAMGTGLTLVGLFALGLHPTALGGMLPVRPETIRLLALGLGGGLLAILLWLSVSRKSLRVRGYEISMPTPRVLAGQLVVALFDSLMAAATLYVLLPPGAPDFVTFLAIYAAAMMVGILSHVPGGVGVFETVVLAAMPAGTAVSDVAAALLLFRIIYYLLPFAIAFVLIAINEARLAGGMAARLFGDLPEPARQVTRAIAGAVPALAGVWAVGFGFYLLAVSLLPAVRGLPAVDDAQFRAVLLEAGAMISALSGGALLILSHGLVRRIERAYRLAILAMAAGVVAALLGTFDFERAAVLMAGGLVLLPFRREFQREGRVAEGLFGPAWFALLLAYVLAGGAFFYLTHENTPMTAGLLTEFAWHADTARALRALLAAVTVLVLFTLYTALRPAGRMHRTTAGAALASAARIAIRQDVPMACLALAGDKKLILADSRQSFVMYGQMRANWVALGDPVGRAQDARPLAWSFFEEANRAGRSAVFYKVGSDNLGLWNEMGLDVQKIGEEAIIPLSRFTLGHPRFSALRAAQEAGHARGLGVHLMRPPHSPSQLAELWELAQEAAQGTAGLPASGTGDRDARGGPAAAPQIAGQIAERAGRRRAFVVGRKEARYLDHFTIAALRDRSGRLMAFANLLAPGTGRRAAIDLVYARPGDAAGLTACLFLAIIERLQAAGGRELSLGMAPLEGLGGRQMQRIWGRLGHLIFPQGDIFSSPEDLRAFKQQFGPDWHPRFMALAPGAAPRAVMRNIARLIEGEGSSPSRAARPPGRTG